MTIGSGAEKILDELLFLPARGVPAADVPKISLEPPPGGFKTL